MMCKYFTHSFQRVSIVFVLTILSYQAEYLIFRKWPIACGRKGANERSFVFVQQHGVTHNGSIFPSQF